MKFIKEGSMFIHCKCEHCSFKITNILISECTKTENGYIVNHDVKCFKCKRTSTEITYEDEEEVKCPKCRSSQITAGNKGFGLGKAAAGGLLLGPVGLLGGVIGSKKVIITCLKCGHKWQAGK